MPICCAEPRSSRSMNWSPAIWSENRVQRWHSTQRSRSSRISRGDRDRLGERPASRRRSRESGGPLAIVWFCSGHSPPLSQIGQSSGWLSSRNSRLPRCAFSATGERQLGLDDHAVGDRLGAGGLRLGHRPAAHLDLDQALPAGADRFQQRVVAEPRDGGADPLGGADHQLALGRDRPRRRRWSAGRGPRGRARGSGCAGRLASVCQGHQCAPTSCVGPRPPGGVRPVTRSSNSDGST